MSHGKNILVQIIPYDPNGSVFEPFEICLEKSFSLYSRWEGSNFALAKKKSEI